MRLRGLEFRRTNEDVRVATVRICWFAMPKHRLLWLAFLVVLAAGFMLWQPK